MRPAAGAPARVRAGAFRRRPPRAFPAAPRPLEDVRVLSFTHAIAGPTVGRPLAEQGADVLCATRPNDYEHDFIYDEANIGSRSACVDLTTAPGRALAEDLLTGADVVVNNHRGGKPEKIGLDPHQPARRHPGMESVSEPVTGMINDFITGCIGALGAPPPCTSGRPRAAAGTSPSTYPHCHVVPEPRPGRRRRRRRQRRRAHPARTRRLRRRHPAR
ncbi:CoA transferase [Streptomyces sp. NPDC001852]|uniref:CoA transferase n=1 Tax=Streptomyces sp. NPDC001852 TaxID=3364619 RepID=UPI003677815B